jgi:phosphoenolpyruvate carboxykinase (GTP)
MARNTAGLDGFDEARFDQCMAFDAEEWKAEILSQGELFLKLYDYLPKELVFQRMTGAGSSGALRQYPF